MTRLLHVVLIETEKENADLVNIAEIIRAVLYEEGYAKPIEIAPARTPFEGPHQDLINLFDRAFGRSDYAEVIRRAGLDWIYKQALNAGYGTPAYKFDSKADDDVFCLYCKHKETIGDTIYYELDRDGITVTDVNFPNPTEAFNLYYTPKRNLLNHHRLIASILKYFETKYLEKTTIGKYPGMSTQAGSNPIVVENVSELVSAFTLPLFMPFYMTFTAPCTNAFEAAYLASPYAPIQISWENNNYTAYLFAMQKKFAGQKETEFKLLMNYNNDLSNLI